MCQRTWRRWRMRSTQQCQTWKTNCQTWYLRVKYRPELTHITRYNRVIICSVRNPDFVFTFFLNVLLARLMRASTLFSTIEGGKRHLLRVSGIDDVEQKNKNHETIPSIFFPEQKTKRSCFLRHLCLVHEVLTEKPKFVGCKIRGMRSWLVFLLFGVFTPLQWRTWTRDFDFYVLDVCICLWEYSSMSRSKAF